MKDNDRRGESSRGIALALVGVMAVMLWPVWLAVDGSARTSGLRFRMTSVRRWQC